LTGGAPARVEVMQYIPGIISLMLSICIITYLVRGDRDGSNITSLLVEGAGVFAEIFLIVLVIDQLARHRERMRWKSLHSNMGQTLQRAFVDLMRVNYIFMHPQNGDSARLPEFIDFARFSLSDLRSQIESFTNSLELGPQSDIRSIEKKLNYLFRNFHSLSLKNRSQYETLNPINYENFIFFRNNDNWRVLLDLSNDIDELLTEINFQRDSTQSKVAEEAIAQMTVGGHEETIGYTEFYRIRFGAQQIAIDKLGLKYVLLKARSCVAPERQARPDAFC
jgi:hypothetical protein